MDSSIAPDSHRLARAFLALGDDPALGAVQPSLMRSVAALAAVLALMLAVPLSWVAPAPTPGTKLGEQHATLGSSKAAVAAADDEDDAD